jgi:hypothetical protein
VYSSCSGYFGISVSWCRGPRRSWPFI